MPFLLLGPAIKQPLTGCQKERHYDNGRPRATGYGEGKSPAFSLSLEAHSREMA